MTKPSKPKKILLPINIAIVTGFILLITGCNEPKNTAPVKPDYDLNDEQYQDFYSRYMRQRYKDCEIKCLPDYFKKYNIEEALEIDISQDVGGFVDIRRIDPENDTVNRTTNTFKTEQDVLDYYAMRRLDDKYGEFIVKPCAVEDRVEGLFCLESNIAHEYYYLPPQSGGLPYINNSIRFYCTLKVDPIEKRSCTVFNTPHKPFNLDVGMRFYNPNNFFYVMPYVEQLIYNSSGEHVWQSLPKQK